MKKKFSTIVGTILLSTFIVVAAVASVYTIDAESCTNCGLCTEVCPVEAISQSEVDGKEVHVIDAELCTGCGLCVEECPVEAISLLEEDTKATE